MDLNNLNNTQIVLLAVLVSFITSIATGITTVTLMQEAPPQVTQPITRVVKQTVEKIIPGETREITKEITETVIIKEEDLIVEAINKNKGSLVSVAEITDEESAPAVIGGGFLISEEGLVAVDSAIVSSEGEYSVSIGDNIFPAEFVAKSERGFSLLGVLQAEEINFSSVDLVASRALSAGQSVIALSGPPLNVSTGIISGFEENEIEVPTPEGAAEENEESQTLTETIIDKILISFSLLPAQSGSLIVDTDGEAIGFGVVRDGKTHVIPSDFLLAAVSRVLLSQESSGGSQNGESPESTE